MAAVRASFDELCTSAGITREKPLYAVLAATMQAAEAAQGAGKGLTPEAERDLVRRVVATVGESAERHIDRLAWRIGFWNTVKVALVGVMLCAGGYGVGYYQASSLALSTSSHPSVSAGETRRR